MTCSKCKEEYKTLEMIDDEEVTHVKDGEIEYDHVVHHISYLCPSCKKITVK